MKKLFIKKTIILLIIVFIIITLDFKSKQWIFNNITLNEYKSVNSLLNIYHIHNYGAAFNIFSDYYNSRNYLLCYISFIIILILIKLIYISLKYSKTLNMAYILILSGALGNFIDRIYFGFVIDFIDLHVYNWHFATFNIADISIFIGAILFIYKTKKNIY